MSANNKSQPHDSGACGSTTLLREALDVLEDAIDTLEAQGLHVDNALYTRLTQAADRFHAALQSQPTGETWQSLSCDAQYDLAQRIAANVGYVLAPEPAHPDSPHAPSPSPDRLRAEERLAVENLRTHQEQCDMDGVMVKVSR